MVAWFIVAIITIGLFAAISLNGVGLVSNAQNAGQRAETVRRINAVMTALQAQAAAPRGDGIVYAPAGTFGSSEYNLPANLLPIGITTFGRKFTYCPMGLALGAQNATVSYAGGSYPIETAEMNGKGYVISGRLPTTAASDVNVIGFVLAQITPEGTLPGCGDIVRDGDAYTAPNGIVRALRRDSTANVDAVRSNGGGVWYVSPDGNGSGQSPGTPGSAAAAMAAYRSSLGGTFTIVFAAGSYSVSGNPLDQTVTAMEQKKENSSLILKGTGTAALSLGTSINVPGSLEMSNLNVEGMTIFASSGHYTRAVNSSLGPLVAMSRSRFILPGTNTVRGIASARAAINQLSGSSVLVPSATLTVYYVANAPAWYVENGGSTTVTTSNVYFAPSTGMGNQDKLVVTESNSAMVLKSSTMNFGGPSTFPVYLAGRMTAYSTTFNYNAATYVGVQTVGAEEVNLHDVTIRGSSPPAYGISALGTSNVTGYGNVYSTNRCWYRHEGSVFRYSPVGIQGATSTVTPDEPLPGMSPQPTAAEVRRYQGAVSRNTAKTILRTQLNPTAGTFTCQQSAPPINTYCAAEGGYCNGMNAYSLVIYGAGSTFNQRYVAPEEGTPCDNATFGDPAVGIGKSCYYQQ
jgi:hypothetical protein